jgi:hypothetical protein
MSDSKPLTSQTEHHGVIAWMIHNRITPNVMMAVFLLGGLFMATRIKQEVFPEFDLGIVTIQVAYPGSSPEEVEQGIILVVEEAIRGLDGIKEITATRPKGSASSPRNWRKAVTTSASIRISSSRSTASSRFRWMRKNRR